MTAAQDSTINNNSGISLDLMDDLLETCDLCGYYFPLREVVVMNRQHICIHCLKEECS